MKSRKIKVRKLQFKIYSQAVEIPITRLNKESVFGFDLLGNLLAKFVVIILIAGLNWTGLSAIGETLGLFNDIENSPGNFTAASLDFVLNPNGFAPDEIYSGETALKTINLLNAGNLDFQYNLRAENLSGDLCGHLNLTASLDGSQIYNGPLSGFTALTEIFDFEEPDIWNFEAAFSESGLDGQTCDFDFIYNGWQKDVLDYGSAGFSDTETEHNFIKVKEAVVFDTGIVINEFLPKPHGLEYGFDFGHDNSDMPQGEWVELFNNGAVPVDLSGWYVWDASGSETQKIYITGLNTQPASTIINSGDWLVVYMNKAVLNNGNDTVKLFNNENILIDFYSYGPPPDFCDLEPTPGEENDNAGTGSCSGVPDNKSYARIPDGSPNWVDPIPTPGRPNIDAAPIEIGLVSTSTAEVEVIENPIEEEQIIEEEQTAEEPKEEPIQEPIIKQPADEPAIPEETVILEEINDENL